MHPHADVDKGYELDLVSERSAAAAAWATVERAGGAPVAASWAWTETWLETFGDVVPHRFALLKSGGRPVAAALLTEETRRLGPLRTRAVHIGTAGEPAGESVFVEYNRPLGSASDRAALAALLVERLDADELILDGFAPDEAAPFLEGAASVTSEPCPLAVLPPEGDVLDTLASGTRRRLRRSLRGFEAVETEWAADPAAAVGILDELIELHQRRWTAAGEPGAFASDRFTAFHRALVPRLVERGAALLFRVCAAGATIGCLYSFVEDQRVLFYQSGFAAFEDSKLKPGLVSHALCMQECQRRGLREYNFLAGDSQYKRELATGEDTLVWAVVSRTARARAAAAARSARRSLRRAAT